MELTKYQKKNPLGVTEIKRLMAGPTNIIRIKNKPKIVATKSDTLTSDVNKFLDNGGKIKTSNPEDRGMQEWVWWQETYPVNYNKRR